MAAVSPAFGSAYWAGATSSHPGAGHDREPRRGGPGISPGDSDAREPRDTDPRQHLWSPVGAAQLAVPPGKIPLRRSMTHCGRIPVIQPPRTAAHPPRSKESSQSSAKPRQILPNPAKSCQICSDAGSLRWQKALRSGHLRAKAGESGHRFADEPVLISSQQRWPRRRLGHRPPRPRHQGHRRPGQCHPGQSYDRTPAAYRSFCSSTSSGRTTDSSSRGASMNNPTTKKLCS